ncbi:MAG: ABC transporter ATP-binding protein [Candidatus Bathyarchaeia archaeon]
MVTAISIENLSWRYEIGRDWTLKDITLNIEEGEFLGIVGPSGAGKTTLSLCLAGLIPHMTRGVMRGSVKIYGMDTSNMRLREIVRGVGIVFQDPETQFVTMSVEDEVAFPMENYAFPRGEMVKRVEEALKATRMQDHATRYPYELSGGQKQRVAIASFLALRPDILVLDEPTSDLDPAGKSEVFSIIDRLRDEYQTTLIVIEHNTEELAKYASRVVLLDGGRIVREGACDTFFDDVPSLQEHGVYPPQVTELCYRLENGNKQGLPITIEQTIAYLKDRISVKGPIQNVGGRPWRPVGEGDDVILRVEGLRFTYPDGTEALKGIEFEVRRGEYVAVIGQNASGKTTLVKHLVGLLKPTQGDVYVFGLNTKKVSVNDLARNVGYVYQNPDHQLFCHTVYEECAYGLRNLGLSEAEVKSRVKNVLEKLGMAGLENTESFILGKGQRQRLAVATVLVMAPEVIIIDEPTTGQDMKQSESIMNLLDQLNMEGKTVIIITHNMRLVAEHVKRAIVMADGKILLDGNVREVFSNMGLLERTFLTPPQITLLANSLSPGLRGVLTVDELEQLIELR